ncbi:MAG: DUF1549 domain-containing protein [Verrucomicrobiaceae bacterium]|nr:DUF1549 domain-containing protein [Verrucomicrobiaceae bacterium]
MKTAHLGLFTVLLSLSATAAPVDTKSAAKAIDVILQKDWAANKLEGNPMTDDNTFVRRIYLDVIGRIPTTREAETFLNDKSADKRAKLIDKLLGSEGYVQHFYNYWADVLRVTSNGNQTGGITGAAYMKFVKESLRANKPYDQFVRDMVAAQGEAWDNGAIGYYMRDRGMPLDNMANTVRVFLGTRIECAQCHNHPFDKWTQMQFYKMAAFTYGVQTQDYYGGVVGEVRDMVREQTEETVRTAFKEPTKPEKPQKPEIKGKLTKEQSKQIEKEFSDKRRTYETALRAYDNEMRELRKKQNDLRQKLQREQRSFQEPMNDIRDTMRYTQVSFQDTRKPSLPHDYQYSDAKPRSTVSPGTMMGHDCETMPGETPLQAYARWMTSKDNPRFTTVIANRLWKRAFGLALIEPLDELMDTTVPMNKELQTHLEKLVKDAGYDMKAVLRVLYNTSAYQRQVNRKEYAPGEVYHFTGPLLRRMSAEQMWDSFVTLINPNPDMINVTARETMEQRVLQAKKNADSMESLTPEEALRGFKLAGEVYSKNRERTEGAQKRYADARTAAKEAAEKADAMKAGPEKDKAVEEAKKLRAAADKIRSEVNTIQNEGRRVTFAEVLLPGQKKLYQQVTGKPYTNAVGSSSTEAAPAMMSGDMMMMAAGPRAERVKIPGYDRNEPTPEERKAEQEARDAAYREEAEYFGITDAKLIRKYIENRRNVASRYLRAAEVESPAPRGHYLREFGQSDRETIENANNEASVPQALAMMNGELLPAITSSYSQLMLAISKAQYPDDKVEAAYMTILSRKPTAKEKEAWLKAQDQGLSSMEDLVFSLLNTQQFIFVQ